MLEARLTRRTVLKNTFEEARIDGTLNAAPAPRSRTTTRPPAVRPGRAKSPTVAHAAPAQGARQQEPMEHARQVLSETLLYPLEARKRGLEGETVLLLVLGPEGEILRVDIAKSSGHEVLDKAAVAAAVRLGRLPASGRQVLLSVPFQLY